MLGQRRKLREMMLRDGVDEIPDRLLTGIEPRATSARSASSMVQPTIDRERVGEIAKGTVQMVEEAQDLGFAAVSAEFFVKDVEANLEFFEKLGFKRRWTETTDAMGRLPRASLRGGVGRIWLRRASEAEGTRPMPGVVIYFWIDGGEAGLTAHRQRVVSQGVAASPIQVDVGLRNFTVTSPDGYTIGFFAQYES